MVLKNFTTREELENILHKILSELFETITKTLTFKQAKLITSGLTRGMKNF